MLRPGQIRCIHAQLYANLINELAIDGRIDEDEEQILQTTRVWLTTLGWCP